MAFRRTGALRSLPSIAYDDVGFYRLFLSLYFASSLSLTLHHGLFIHELHTT
jgi:hypothetical protein